MPDSRSQIRWCRPFRLAATVAIVSLTVKAAVRSKVVLCLAFILLGSVFCLSVAIAGDGTLEGLARVLVSYDLKFGTAILGVTAILASSAVVSREISGRQLQLVDVKPVPRGCVWLGKWLGAVIVGGAMAALLALATFSVLYWRVTRTWRDGYRALCEEILAPKRVIRPEAVSYAEEARRRVAAMRKEGRLGRDVAVDRLVRTMEDDLAVRNAIVLPGSTNKWVFRLRRKFDWEAPIWLRVAFQPASLEHRFASGTWALGSGEGAGAYFAKTTMNNRPGGVHILKMPTARFSGADMVTVLFANDPMPDSGPVAFSKTAPVELLVGEGSFSGNYSRALLVTVAGLSLLVALGLTAGCMFTFPVAAFAAFSVTAMALITQYFAFAEKAGREWGPEAHLHGQAIGKVQRVLQQATTSISGAVHMVVAPVTGFDPIRCLSSGELITWSVAGRAIVLMGIVYPAILGLLSTGLLSRRELAIPED